MRALIGLLRSLLIYYAVPLRALRMRRWYRQFITEGDTAFDIGAHVGNRIRTWLKLGATVVAVEPQPVCRPVLRALYGRNARVALVWAAVSDIDSECTLYVSHRHPTLATVSRRWIDRAARAPGFSHVAWDATARVPCVTLDQLIQLHGQPTFIKIDVEGHEEHVIASLSTPVKALSFEYLPADVGVALACIDHLQTLADYRYNLSPGESMHRLFKDWVDAQTVHRHLRSLGPDAVSGDVYARIHSATGFRAQNVTNSS